MAHCGIDTFDELPSRVGTYDVDYMRFRLVRLIDESKRKENEVRELYEELELVRRFYLRRTKEE